MSTRYVSFDRIAESKGVDVEAVREAAARGEFAAALSKDGRRINAYHSAAKAWLEGEYVPRARPGRPPSLNDLDDDAPIFAVRGPAEIQRIAEAVILVTERGTPAQVQKWSRVRKEIAAAAAAEAKRDQATGQLVPRALVQRAAIGYVDGLLRGLHNEIGFSR